MAKYFERGGSAFQRIRRLPALCGLPFRVPGPVWDRFPYFFIKTIA